MSKDDSGCRIVTLSRTAVSELKTVYRRQSLCADILTMVDREDHNVKQGRGRVNIAVHRSWSSDHPRNKYDLAMALAGVAPPT